MTRRLRFALGAGLIALIAAGIYFSSDTQQEPDSAPIASAAKQSSHAWGPSPFDAGAANQSLPFPQEKRVPGQLYGRNGRVIDLQGKNVTDFIAQWSSAARNGDVAAAYKVFQAADLCAGNDAAVPDFRSDAEREDFMQERERITRLCEGVTPAQIQERMRFLDTAAHAGNRDAQIDFYMEGPQGTTAQIDENDPVRLQWKTDSLAYLKAAGNQGDAFALGLLANVYYAGLLGEADPKLSLAYTVANATARNIEMSPEALRARYGDQLSEADFNAALQMGSQISAACCKK